MKNELKKCRPITSEKSIEKKCVMLAQQEGWLALKMDGSGQTHYPDRLFIHPDGGIFFVEFKTSTGRLSPGQQLTITSFVERGFIVYCCRSVEEFKDVLGGMKK